MKRTLLFIVSCVVLFITGCGTTPSATVQPPSYERIPVALVQDCAVEPPPSPDVYAQTKAWVDREKLLMDTLKLEIKNLSDCNVTKRNLREWDQKQYDLIKSYQPTPGTTGSLSNVGKGTAGDS